MRRMFGGAPLALLLLIAPVTTYAVPLGNGITYQGHLKDGGVAVNSDVDFYFLLMDAETGGLSVGNTVLLDAVPVVDGVFTVELDFGTGAFNGDARWLEVYVRTPPGVGNYTLLDPRQPITAAPVALYALDGPGSTWSQNGSDVYYDAGNVGIGTSLPTAFLEIDAEGDDQALRIAHSDDVTNLVTIERTVDCYFAADILELKAQAGSNPTAQFIECEMPGDFKFRVWTDGDVTADGTITAGGADFAEMVHVPSGASGVEPGDVMVIDVDNPRAVARSSNARSTLVAGIYSTSPGLIGSEHDWDQIAANPIGSDPDRSEAAGLKPTDVGFMIDEIPLAVVGIVPCKVSAENGPITPGDLLVTSDTPGHAMRDENPRNGTIVGKAFGSLKSGTGVIKVLVTLQ